MVWCLTNPFTCHKIGSVPIKLNWYITHAHRTQTHRVGYYVRTKIYSWYVLFFRAFTPPFLVSAYSFSLLLLLFCDSTLIYYIFFFGWANEWRVDTLNVNGLSRNAIAFPFSFSSFLIFLFTPRAVSHVTVAQQLASRFI